MTRYSRLDLASVQLDKAIALFLDGEHLCALTLAGAAEEILGKLTNAAGNVHALEAIASDMVPKLALQGVFTDAKEVYRHLNHARNGAKHVLPAEELVVDWPDSLVMLLRAVPMARELGVRTALQDELIKWVVANHQTIVAYTD